MPQCVRTLQDSTGAYPSYGSNKTTRITNLSGRCLSREVKWRRIEQIFFFLFEEYVYFLVLYLVLLIARIYIFMTVFS